MADPILLHPKIRERVAPRLSNSALAEFIISRPDKQDDVLHDARFMKATSVFPHSDAIRAIQAYCYDLHRPISILDKAQQALTEKSLASTLTPFVRDEASRCVESIELFKRGENAFGLAKFPLVESPRFPPVKLHGVEISSQPHVIVGHSYPPLIDNFGVIFFRPQKTPNPDDCVHEATRVSRTEHRRELARYMLVIARMFLLQSGHKEDDLDLKKMFVCDLRIKECIDFPGDRVSRERHVKAACGQIARLWSSVEPRASDYEKAG